MSRPDVLVVGGGVVGGMCAYYLARAGRKVVVLDADVFGAACSHGNCGYVCPSHVLPLTQPGAVGRAMWTAWRKSSPLYIKPRLSPALWAWLIRFAMRCNHRDMMQAAEGLHPLLRSSRAETQRVIQEAGIDCDFEPGGLMYVYRTAAGMDHFRESARLIQDEFQIEIESLGPEQLLAREPALIPGAAVGGYIFPDDAHLRPDLLMAGLRAALEKIGGTVRNGVRVTGFVSEAGQVRAALSDGGSYEADQFVVATGAMTPMLNEHLGCKIPIQPGKGYSITMDRPKVCPTYPMIFEQEHVAVTPFKSGYRIGSTMEFSGYDDTLSPARLEALRVGAAKYLKDPHPEPTRSEWYGWRPMTWDGLPIISRSPTLENIVIAAGHNMLGLSQAAGTGRLVCEIIGGQETHIDTRPYRADRF